ncbi:MAG: hypothetical protein WA214_22185, partial [Pseudolabrys sp.]
LLMLCRKKNPDILNIVGHTFLEDCAIEGVTSPSKGRGKTIKTFRNALGFDGFVAEKKAPIVIRPPANANPIPPPTAQASQPSAPIAQPGK